MSPFHSINPATSLISLSRADLLGLLSHQKWDSIPQNIDNAKVLGRKGGRTGQLIRNAHELLMSLTGPTNLLTKKILLRVSPIQRPYIIFLDLIDKPWIPTPKGG
jgi:hypothetical protein